MRVVADDCDRVRKLAHASRRSLRIVLRLKAGLFHQIDLKFQPLGKQRRGIVGSDQRAVPDFIDFQCIVFAEESTDRANLSEAFATERTSAIELAVVGVRMADEINVHGLSRPKDGQYQWQLLKRYDESATIG
jgi:hypothetical protein